MENHSFGKKIATLQKQHGLTKTALADILGVSVNTLSNWERVRHPHRLMQYAIFAAHSICHLMILHSVRVHKKPKKSCQRGFSQLGRCIK